MMSVAAGVAIRRSTHPYRLAAWTARTGSLVHLDLMATCMIRQTTGTDSSRIWSPSAVKAS